jgi:uncharacterized protein YlzI (FlbEa/FlbD family)
MSTVKFTNALTGRDVYIVATNISHYQTDPDRPSGTSIMVSTGLLLIVEEPAEYVDNQVRSALQ